LKYLIIGLGNIGEEYANTRHNIGFVILDALAKDIGITFSAKRYANVSKFKYKSRIFILIKPNTYINLSGKAVNYWIKKEKVPIEKVLIIVDDIALPLGTLRMKSAGGDGGHNGLINIIETLGTNNFPRLRFGTGNDFAKGRQVEYVLGKWSEKEEKLLIPHIEQTVEMIKKFGTVGIDRTMAMFNNK
jgi:PTH1 family peptidyl-tRNA hydrolase